MDITQINSEVLADGAVTATKIAAGAVTGSSISITSQAAGDLMYYNGTAWTRVPAGTAGNVLKTAGTTAAPYWESATPVPQYIKLNGNNGTDIAFAAETQLLTSTYYTQEFTSGITWNSTTGTVTVSTAGVYKIDYFLYVRVGLAPNNGRFQIRKNGTPQVIHQTGLSLDGIVSSSILVNMAAGNYIDVIADAFDLGAVYMGYAHTAFSMHKV